MALGYFLHSRVSFKGHGSRDNVGRSAPAASSSSRSSAWPEQPVRLGVDRSTRRADLVAAAADAVRDARCHLRHQPALGVRLRWRKSDGTHRLRPHGGARQPPLVVSRPARHPRRPDRAPDRTARQDPRILEIGCGTGHNLVDAQALRPGRRDRDRSGRPGHRQPPARPRGDGCAAARADRGGGRSL